MNYELATCKDYIIDPTLSWTCKNKKKHDVLFFLDPYVKVSLMCEGKRIKKRKTSVKKNTLNPVYNEALVFDVPQENVDDVYLVVKVIDYDRWVDQNPALM